MTHDDMRRYVGFLYAGRRIDAWTTVAILERIEECEHQGKPCPSYEDLRREVQDAVPLDDQHGDRRRRN